MANITNKDHKESYDRISSILISQPKPERSSYFDIEKKWGIKIDWRPFIHVEGVTEKEFRKNRLKPDDYSAVVFNSLNSIEHFFRLCKEMRIEMSASTKYFCLTQSIANYLQKFIVYRKRKVFVGVRKVEDLSASFQKHKETENFLVPCSNLGSDSIVKFLTEGEYNFQEAMMYKTVSSDLSDLKDITYDVLVFFSPTGIKSLFENFPDFAQKKTRMAIYGSKTSNAVREKGLTINIAAPAENVPSMSMAITNYLKLSNK